MNKIFTNATLDQRLTIFSFLKEERIATSFNFGPEAHEYFKDKYPEVYGSREGYSHLMNHARDLYLTAEILGAELFKSPVLYVAKLEYESMEGRLSDRWRLFTCPAYPEGVNLTIPVLLVTGISISKVQVGW